MVPVGHSVLDNARKALKYLADCQHARLVHPNKTFQAKDNSMLRDMINRHLENDLVHATMKGRQDKGDNCKFRDSYSNLEHIRMLSYTWMVKGSVIAPLIREHFVIAASHGMLLRGEDLRGLAFANCFIQQIPKGRLDSQAVHMLTFVMEEGKTIVGERKEYAGAVRHEDVRRCVVGAFAFYIFDRFHNKEEDPIDFENLSWQKIKVLCSGKNYKEEMSYPAARNAMNQVFKSQSIRCTAKTHSGRKSGALEAELLGILEEDIRKGGRWIQNTGKMHQHYLAKLPLGFARGMAGFKDKPFHLPRNELVPSIELQKKIFPWIEEAFGKHGSRERRLWENQCLEIMNDTETIRTVNMKDISHYAEPLEAVDEGHETESAIAKAKFLTLLVYLRRVIIQDAVAYLSEYRWSGPVLENDIFTKDELFLAFKKDLSARLSARVEQEFAAEVHPAVVNAIQDSSVVIRDEMLRREEEHRKEIRGLQSQLSDLQRLLIQSQTDLVRQVQQLSQQNVAAGAGLYRRTIQGTPTQEEASSSQTPLRPQPSSAGTALSQDPNPSLSKLPNMPEIIKPYLRYNHTSATTVYDEYKAHKKRAELIKQRKSLDPTYRSVDPNSYQAQLSLRKWVVKEADFLASNRTIGSDEERLIAALAELDMKVIRHNWSTNQLIQHCRKMQTVREWQRKKEVQAQQTGENEKGTGQDKEIQIQQNSGEKRTGQDKEVQARQNRREKRTELDRELQIQQNSGEKRTGQDKGVQARQNRREKRTELDRELQIQQNSGEKRMGQDKEVQIQQNSGEKRTGLDMEGPGGHGNMG
ncbi:unnamed protein product [Mortierella alpina]